MAGSAVDFMKDNVWLPIIIGIVSFFLLLLLIYLGYKLYRRCTRYDYTPLKEDMALPEKLSQARQMQRNEVRETALLNFQFYLRSRSGSYSYSEHLPDMGSRLDKHWFLVRQHNRWKDLVATQCTKSPSCPMPFTNSSQKTIRDLVLALEHPYLWPLQDIDLWEEQDMVIVVQELNPSGSLKDYIYNVKPRHDWSNKYGMQSRGLPLKQIKLFGLQILRAVLYLQENGFPPHCHIQTGNVMVKKGVCYLAGHENVFLGYTSKIFPLIRRLIKDKPEAIDTISFGHLLYEMSAGRELEDAIPTRAQLNRCQYPELMQLLEFIFDVAGDYPSISNIAQHSFFANQTLKELWKHQPKNIHLTAAMKALIKAAKKGKVLKKHSSKSRSANSTKHMNKNKNSKRSSNAGLTETANSIQTNTSKPVTFVPPPPPVAPAPPPPPPAVGFSPAPSGADTGRTVPSTEGRGALLSDIRKGMSLKKTNTNNPRV